MVAVDGCNIPTSLAVGAHFDCNYSDRPPWSASDREHGDAPTAKRPEPEDDDATVDRRGPAACTIVKSVPDVPEGFAGTFVRPTITSRPDSGHRSIGNDRHSRIRAEITIDDFPAGVACAGHRDQPERSARGLPVGWLADQTAPVTIDDRPDRPRSRSPTC